MIDMRRIRSMSPGQRFDTSCNSHYDVTTARSSGTEAVKGQNTPSALEALRNALYKFKTYLLTYLATGMRKNAESAFVYIHMDVNARQQWRWTRVKSVVSSPNCPTAISHYTVAYHTSQNATCMLVMCGNRNSVWIPFLKTESSKNLTSVQTVFRQKLHAICNSNKKLIEATLLALHVHIRNVLKHDRNRV